MANHIGTTICMDCGQSTLTVVKSAVHYRSIKGMCLKCAAKFYLGERRARNKSKYGNVNGHEASVIRVRNNQRCLDWNDRLKSEVIVAYGGKCALCVESNSVFLTIDHTNGDGAEERRRYRANFGGASLYKYLRDLEWPKDRYRLLCYNCNLSLAFTSRPRPGGANAARVRNANLLFKLETLAKYGGACVCCSENDPIRLTIDHVLTNGAWERKNGLTGRQLYKHIRDLGYPPDYRILCYNCNVATYRLGNCPHRSGVLL